jgi:hypothetical protein
MGPLDGGIVVEVGVGAGGVDVSVAVAVEGAGVWVGVGDGGSVGTAIGVAVGIGVGVGGALVAVGSAVGVSMTSETAASTMVSGAGLAPQAVANRDNITINGKYKMVRFMFFLLFGVYGLRVSRNVELYRDMFHYAGAAHLLSSISCFRASTKASRLANPRCWPVRGSSKRKRHTCGESLSRLRSSHKVNKNAR